MLKIIGIGYEKSTARTAIDTHGVTGAAARSPFALLELYNRSQRRNSSSCVAEHNSQEEVGRPDQRWQPLWRVFIGMYHKSCSPTINKVLRTYTS